MAIYRYSPLPKANTAIRLLRLLPATTDDAEIRVELFDYDLQKPKHSYEALSYVWGAPDPARTIKMNDNRFDITPNLNAALVQLRDHSFPRILWIDAICINQQDYEEKGVQIQHMAKIYASAKRVVVYLGEAADGSDEAMEAIRAAGIRPRRDHNEDTVEAIYLLLQRDWFQRIWVLQEVAAARHIIVMCGNTEIDGQALCLALDNFPFQDTHEAAYHRLRSVFSLIREAIFRPRFDMSSNSKALQNTCSIGELMSMYNTRRATVRHDKIIALLGMASQDDFSNLKNHGLLPDYRVSWQELLRRLVQFILGSKVRIETRANEEKAEIFGKGYFMGIVSSLFKDSSGSVAAQIAEFEPVRTKKPPKVSSLPLPASANEVRVGDLVWIFEGSAHPMIIRRIEMFFYIIMIEVPSTRGWESRINPRNIATIWDWADMPKESFSPGSMEAINRWTTILILQYLNPIKQDIDIGIELMEMDHVLDEKDSSRPLCAPDSIIETELIELIYMCNERAMYQLLCWMKSKGKSHDPIQVGESVILAIAKRHGRSLLEKVLQLHHNPASTDVPALCSTNTEDIVSDDPVQKHGDDRSTGLHVETTEAVLVAAVRARCSTRTINQLAKSVAVTDAPLVAGLESYYTTEQMLLLLNYAKPNPITEAVLVAAVQFAWTDSDCPRMEMLLNMPSETRHQITETILLAAVENWNQGPPILEMLLVDRAAELEFPNGKVTSKLLEAAVQDRWHSLRAVAMLLSLDVDGAHITKAVVTEAMNNEPRRHELIPLLCRHSGRARDIYLSVIADRKDDTQFGFWSDLAEAPAPYIFVSNGDSAHDRDKTRGDGERGRTVSKFESKSESVER